MWRAGHQFGEWTYQWFEQLRKENKLLLQKSSEPKIANAIWRIVAKVENLS